MSAHLYLAIATPNEIEPLLLLILVNQSVTLCEERLEMCTMCLHQERRVSCGSTVAPARKSHPHKLEKYSRQHEVCQALEAKSWRLHCKVSQSFGGRGKPGREPRKAITAWLPPAGARGPREWSTLRCSVCWCPSLLRRTAHPSRPPG